MNDKADPGWRLAALACAWLAGVAVHLQMRSLPPQPALLGSLALAIGLQWVAVRRAWRHRFLLGVAVVAVTAFVASGLRANHRLGQALDAELEGVDLVVTGVVASLPQRGPTGLRFPLAVESATRDGAAVTIPPELSVAWFVPPRGDAPLTGKQARLGAGQRWRFALRLRRPHGNMNPHGFDFELKLFEQGVGATATVRDKPSPAMLEEVAGFPVERLRQRVRAAIEAKVADRRVAGVLIALTVGDQGAIQSQDWDVYRATGIAHLVAISGLHIAMFAWLAAAASARLWRLSARAMLLLPTPLAARWSGLACAASYAVFSGGGLPAQRTIWMLGVVTLSRSLGLRWPWPLVLSIAAVVVSMCDPWALLQPGFWLSFAAVGLLMASSEVTAASGDPEIILTKATGWRSWPQRLWPKFKADLRTQVVATVGLAPLTLVFFQQISLVGFIANMIAIPVVTLCVLPLAMLGIVLPVSWTASAWVVARLSGALGWLAALPGAVWTAPVAPAWAQLLALLGAVLLVLPIPWRGRALGGLLILPMLAPARALPPRGGFDLVAVDVGQGTAVLVRTREHLLVYDTGPRYAEDSDAGGRVLLPLLRARGEKRIDRMVLSHRDSDHVGGAASLAKAIPVASLWSSVEDEGIAGPRAGAPQDARCEAGQAWDWDGVHFEILQPSSDSYSKALKPNARSCVLRVSAGARSVLLAGDIERAQELELAKVVPDSLRSTVLIVPHHGSKTSSTVAFIESVDPRVAVFQAGYRSRFGHPAPEILQRYADRGVLNIATPACGAFTIRWTDPVEGRCQRETDRRYWHLGGP